MISFMAGVVVGVGAVAAKDYLGGDKAQGSKPSQGKLEQLYAENEKLRDRNREAERRIEDLMAENQRLKRRSKDRDESRDDLEDDLADAQRKVKRLQQQNDDLARKVQELKQALESSELELAQLKKIK